MRSGGLVATDPLERSVYQRERENRVYTASSYWIATQLAHLPLQLLAPIPFLFLVYWVTGLNTNFARFVAYVVIIMVSCMCANSLGMFMGALFPAQVATVTTPATAVLLFLVGGFFLYPGNMPDWLYWTRYLSWFTYANDALTVNEFSGESFYCKPDQYQTYTFNYTCPGSMQVITNTTRVCPTTSGQQVIDFRSSDKIPVFANVLVMFGIVLLLRTLLYIPLRFAKPHA
jgi:ABC-type multidrug transport system permease subunit